MSQLSFDQLIVGHVMSKEEVEMEEEVDVVEMVLEEVEKAPMKNVMLEEVSLVGRVVMVVCVGGGVAAGKEEESGFFLPPPGSFHIHPSCQISLLRHYS